MKRLRTLVVVLGDQLDAGSAAFDGFDAAQDAVWMCEAPAEATYAWSHKARIALFLSAMRHFAALLRARGWRVHYLATGSHPHATLAGALEIALAELCPTKLVLLEPGEWRLEQDFIALAARAGIDIDVRSDRHFLLARAEFAQWWSALQAKRRPAATPPTPRMEDFYRWMRRRTGVLMEADKPAGGRWNYDADNRGSFGKAGPPRPLPPRFGFAPDVLTREVLAAVEQHYAEHPGSLAGFDWPVTREEALESLDVFITRRLPLFGQFQDAMWTGEAWLLHSHLAAALNLKLLNPREVCEAAEAAWRRGEAPLAAVEGFVRQILGWREYVRGIYWQRMPEHLDDNALAAAEALPAFYWSGETDARCLAEAIGQTLQHGYAHHIQRLMVTGLFALLLGVRPRAVHEWYLAVYVDAVEWVELPNTLGMSQFADGGFMATKPYIASGKYIQRMSNYCAHCRYDPAQATGPKACPFTTLYWDFLDRHAERFAAHPRLGAQVLNLQRKSDPERALIRAGAAQLRQRLRPA